MSEMLGQYEKILRAFSKLVKYGIEALTPYTVQDRRINNLAKILRNLISITNYLLNKDLDLIWSTAELTKTLLLKNFPSKESEFILVAKIVKHSVFWKSFYESTSWGFWILFKAWKEDAFGSTVKK